MSYYHDLAFQLRLRRLPEAQIVEILYEVQDLCEQAEQEPKEQFGPAAAYAGQVPKGTTMSSVNKAANVVLLVTVAAMAANLVLALLSGSSLRVGPVPVYFVLLAVQVVVIVGAIVADHRLPGAFRASEPATSG